MASSRWKVLDDRSLRVLFDEGSVAVRSDADLLRLFVAGHGEAAEAAFAALIARHGPMVMGVCRRILRDEHAAEDAFQAVFLILAHKARSVRVDDSLGRWLHGVTRRVAIRAREMATRELPAPVITRNQPDDPAAAAVRAEVRQIIDAEVARLPRKYREAVALCHLDGLTHDQAAEALGLAVGTVRSRLSRARDLLRGRLVRRGLAPTVLAAWLGSRPAVAGVSRTLFEATPRITRRVADATITSTVLILAHHTLRSFWMMKAIGAAAMAVALGCLTTGALVLARGGDSPLKAATRAEPAQPEKAAAPAQAASLEDQFRRIIAEFNEAKARAEQAASAGKNDFERWQTRSKMSPDEAAYSRKVVDLAATHPKERATRDALIWVLNKTYMSDGGAYGDEFSRAVRLLVSHHADDPEVARVGLNFDNILSRHRDEFLEGIYANAEGREARGLARLAMARYLEKKAQFAAGARKFPGRSIAQYETYDDRGKIVEKKVALSNEEEGYRVHLRMLDPESIRRESERLYEEVIAEFADVPYLTTKYRELEREARETPSSTMGDPAKKLEMIVIERFLAEEKSRTLGPAAAERLDDMRNLTVGKVAPDFAGAGADGKPLRLSDYRGKVVAMVYWFSSCGPCLDKIPHHRELTAKMKGRPFTLLGIVTDDRAEEARKMIKTEGMTWPNLVVGGDKVAEQYHVSGTQAIFIIDDRGVIRSKGYLTPGSLDELIEQLVSEAEARGKAEPTSPK